MKFKKGKETTEIHQSVRNIRQKSVACKVIQVLEVKTTAKNTATTIMNKKFS